MTIREEAPLVRCLAIIAVSVVYFAGCVCASQTLSLSLEAPALGNPEASNITPTTKQPQSQSQEGAQTVTVKIGRVGMVQTPSAAIYQSRSTRGPKFTTVKSNTPLAIVKEEGEWYGVLMINGAIGWIPRASVKMTGYELVAKKPAWNAKKDIEPTRGFETSRGDKIDRAGVAGEAIIRTALQYSGVPYVFGGTDPATGMDCSAFVRAVFAQHGIALPRTSREQALVGVTVPFDQLQPGDRLYFSCKNPYIDHCGIYAGNGYFIHCSARKGGVGIDSLASDYYWRSLVVAKR